MASRNNHWILLSLFAIGNLVFWVAVAAGVGLVVSDRVDLGVETLIRQGQATAVAFWEQMPQRIARPTAMPDAAAAAPVPTQAETAMRNPGAVITWSAPSTPEPSVQPGARPENEQTTAATPAPAFRTPTPDPVPTLVARPLLLADPEISSLATLDSEMSRSAPLRPVQIRYQEDSLNREIATLWENNPDLPYRDVWVDFRPDSVAVTGRVTVLGFRVNGQITGRIVVQDCLPELRIETVSLAGVLTPRFVKDQVEEMMLEAIAWYPPDYPLCLEQIVLEETQATVYGYRR